MLSVKEVLGKDKHVWFSVRESEKKRFLKWAKDNGCVWISKEEIIPHKKLCGNFMGISNDLNIGRVSAMCWCLSKDKNLRKIKFEDII